MVANRVDSSDPQAINGPEKPSVCGKLLLYKIWVERAGSIRDPYYDAKIGRRKLGTIYQFIRAMPEVFEPAPAPGGMQLGQLMIR